MIITDPVTGDSCLLVTHESGMRICVAEQPGFHTASAQLGVRFGSVHRRFSADGQTVTLPAGYFFLGEAEWAIFGEKWEDEEEWETQSASDSEGGEGNGIQQNPSE